MKKIIYLCIVVLLTAIPAIGDIHLEEAKKQFAEENYSKARKYVEKSLDVKPGNIPARFLLADTYCAQKKYKPAIKIYLEVMKDKPENIEAQNRLGRAYFSGEYYKDAIGIFEDVLEAEPENVQALYMLGMSYALTMNLDKGYTIFRRLKRKNEKLAKELLHQLQGHLT